MVFCEIFTMELELTCYLFCIGFFLTKILKIVLIVIVFCEAFVMDELLVLYEKYYEIL